MVDIFFKCAACGNDLVVDETRRGMTVECPDCQTPITVPTMLIVRQCPHCRQRLMVAAEMKGALLHCSACREVIRAPGPAKDLRAGETSVVMACPHCHANVNVTEEIANRPTPCPSCGAQVYFRNTTVFKGSRQAGPPKPREHDALLFRRKSR